MNAEEINSSDTETATARTTGTDMRSRRDGPRDSGAGLAINALSRVLAVLVLGAAIAGFGSFLDSWLGTSYWMLVGIIAGTLLAIPGLFLVAKVSELDVKRAAQEAADRDPK